MKITKLLLSCAIAIASSFLVCSCGGDNDEPTPDPGKTTPTDEFNPVVKLPSVIEVVPNEPVTLELTSGSVKDGDKISFKNTAGTFTSYNVTPDGKSAFSFAVSDAFQPGNYEVYMRRDTQSKKQGNAYLNVVPKHEEVAEGVTIYGEVTCEGKPVEGVLVSDGKDIVKTNAEGKYQLRSDKEYGYVFYINPKGYEPESKGAFPQFFKNLVAAPAVPEGAYFELKPMTATNYTVFFMGDKHLAARNDDATQYKKFAEDLNAYRASHSGTKFYGITLGDMSWDIYWKNYSLADYVKDANKYFSDMPIFHTMGNHDNDMDVNANNVKAKNPFTTTVAPNFYSFNLGEVHYIVLDNIDCSTYNNGDRNYKERLFGNQFDWLVKDLAYVDKATPVIITTHAPFFYQNGASTFVSHLESTPKLLETVSGYNAQFISGHTHKVHNVYPEHAAIGGRNLIERNVGSVCGDWWWSGKLTPGALMSQDGTPAGYEICEVNGKEFKWTYKGTGLAIDKQFRAYDLNQVCFKTSDIAGLSGDGLSGWKVYCDAYPANTNNEVLINVWNYNPRWKVEVKTESGQALTATAVRAYDPFHILAMTKKRYASTLTSKPNFTTSMWPHFFKVKAPDADTDLVITVTDEYGRVYRENMERPRAFTEAKYKW